MKKFYKVFCIAIIIFNCTINVFSQTGLLDPTFGSNGKAFTEFSGNDVATAMAVQSNNKIVVAGYSIDAQTGKSSFAVARYNTDGTPDATFGTGGKLTTTIGALAYAQAIAIQSNGKIIIAGSSAMDNSNVTFALVRYNTDGTLDAGFGIGGKQTTAIGSFNFANAIAIQNDGKIIVAGANGDATYTKYFALARYNTDGSLDADFGTGGTLTTAVDNFDIANAIAIQANGKIVVAGTSKNINNKNSFGIVRYNIDGTLDNGFGIGGKQITAFGNDDAANAIALQADGKIVVAGTSTDASYTGSFAVARYNINGYADNSFGTGGKLTTTIALGTSDNATAVSLQNDGKIVVGGTSKDASYATSFALTRYNSNGSLDANFNNSGKATYNLAPATHANANAIKWLANRIYIAGFATVVNKQDFTIASAISNLTVLPISFISLNGRVINNEGMLNFSTYNDGSKVYFEIERSSDGKNFTKVGVDTAQVLGNNQYNFNDKSLSLMVPRLAVVFYRIKQIGKNGAVLYSSILTLKPGVNTQTVVFYPNPVSNIAHITINLTKSEKLSGKISDISGKLLNEENWSLSTGNNTISLNIKNLSKGMYTLHLKGNAIDENIQFIKN